MDKVIPAGNITPESMSAKERYLYEMGMKAQEAKETPVFKEHDGETYVFYKGSMTRIGTVQPDKDQKPDIFTAYTLQGLVDYIKSDIDRIFGHGQNSEPEYTVHVINESRVIVESWVHGFYRERTVVAVCNAFQPRVCFDRYLDNESFQVMVQTLVLPDTNRDLLLKVAGAVRKEQTAAISDDGVSQRLQINEGALVSETTFRNPVPLRPIRTFNEVEQPVSPFVFRVDEDGNMALFEGDGGSWKVQAVRSVEGWLKKQLADFNVVVIG